VTKGEERIMKILLAIDGSEFSEAACQAVVAQVRAEGTEVLVLQVVEPLVFSTPPQMAAGYAPEMAVRLQEQLGLAKSAVTQTAESLRKSGFKVDSRVVENEVRTGILDVAADWHADLIVLGSHGQRRMLKFLLGSVAEYVARHAHCSVLIVPAAEACERFATLGLGPRPRGKNGRTSRRKILAVTGPTFLNSWSFADSSCGVFDWAMRFVTLPYRRISSLEISRSFVAVEKS
jgi:nucleotide-binding universal stress UspA family protein